jgi:hypothetical protein
MALRKKNLTKRKTVKVPYTVLYTHDTAEGKPKAAGQDVILEPPESGGKERFAGGTVPAFAKKK